VSGVTRHPRLPRDRQPAKRHPAQWLYALVPLAALAGAVAIVVELVSR
jgi:hypothetical protein